MSITLIFPGLTSRWTFKHSVSVLTVGTLLTIGHGHMVNSPERET